MSPDPAPFEALAAATVLGLFAPLARDLPAVSETDRTFRPARIDGWLVVMDVASRQPLCQVRVRSGSSPTVNSTWTVNLDTGDIRTPGPNLLLDAETTYRDAARAAFAGIAPAANLYGLP